MKYKLRMVICGVLAVMALTCAVTALAAPGATMPQTLAAADADDGFVLREHDGYIGIFSAGSEQTPMTVTDIEVQTLRAADRELLRAGLHAASYEEVLALLEDLGS